MRRVHEKVQPASPAPGRWRLHHQKRGQVNLFRQCLMIGYFSICAEQIF
jgi:hypothetical protein